MLVFLLVLLLSQAALAAPALVVIFPDEADPRDAAVRKTIKRAREQAGHDVDSMPLMRLYWSLESHRPLLRERLKLSPADLPLAGLVERDGAGWPVRLVERLPIGQADRLVERFADRFQAPLGVLLIARGQAPEVARELQLLGVQALRRYDVSQPEHRDYVTTVLKIPLRELPVAAVARFRRHVPHQILWHKSCGTTPATTARELVAAMRSDAPAAGTDVPAGPPTLPVAMDLLATSVRAHELAQQLARVHPFFQDLADSTGALRDRLEAGVAYPEIEVRRALEAARGVPSARGLNLTPAYQSQLEDLIEHLSRLERSAPPAR